MKSRTEAPRHEIGYWLRKSATGQGVAAAAVSRLVVRAFEGRGVERLTALCDVANDSSAALIQALGFRRVGTLTRAYPDGSPRPLSAFEMDLGRYRARHSAAMRRRARDVRLVQPKT